MTQFSKIRSDGTWLIKSAEVVKISDSLVDAIPVATKFDSGEFKFYALDNRPVDVSVELAQTIEHVYFDPKSGEYKRIKIAVADSVYAVFFLTKNYIDQLSERAKELSKELSKAKKDALAHQSEASAAFNALRFAWSGNVFKRIINAIFRKKISDVYFCRYGMLSTGFMRGCDNKPVKKKDNYCPNCGRRTKGE